MIKSSESFTFNSFLSSDYGISNVSVDSGLYNEPFLASTDIIETTIKNRDVPYFQKMKRKPLEFSVTFAFLDPWDTAKLAELARIFTVNYYAPLVFSEDPSKIYWVLPIGDMPITHQGLQGYISINFRSAFPYATSPVYSSSLYDLSTNLVEGTQIQFVNNGDLSIYPLINIEIISGTAFSIQNLSNSGKIMSFTGLQVNEVLEIDCEAENISTNLPLTYRYNNFQGDYLECIRGVNNLKILGNIKIQFQYEFKILQS